MMTKTQQAKAQAIDGLPETFMRGITPGLRRHYGKGNVFEKHYHQVYPNHPNLVKAIIYTMAFYGMLEPWGREVRLSPRGAYVMSHVIEQNYPRLFRGVISSEFAESLLGYNP